MPDKPKPAAAGKDLKASLTRKVGPFPVWAWGAVLIVGYYAYKKYKGSATGASTSGGGVTTNAQGDPSLLGASGGGAGGAMDNQTGALQGYDSLVNSLLLDNASLRSGAIASNANGSTTTNTTTNNTYNTTTDPGGNKIPVKVADKTTSNATATTSPAAGGVPLQVFGTAPTTAQTAATGTPGSLLSGPPAPAILSAVPNGATNVKLLPSGAVTYVGASGATVEKAPGKSAYVVKAAPTPQLPAAALNSLKGKV